MISAVKEGDLLNYNYSFTHTCIPYMYIYMYIERIFSDDKENKCKFVNGSYDLLLDVTIHSI